MLRRIALITAAIVPALAIAPLHAQTLDQDVKCLIASNFFTKNEKDPQKRQLAAVASFFYLGRLDARVGPAQMKAALESQATTITPASLGQTMTSCATRMRDKGLALQAIGKQAQMQAKPK